jgi:hypothetical protein
MSATAHHGPSRHAASVMVPPSASTPHQGGAPLPKVRAITGNVGAIGLADRENGRVSMITLVSDQGDAS